METALRPTEVVLRGDEKPIGWSGGGAWTDPDTGQTYLPMYSGVIFCSLCPHKKIGFRSTVVLCTTFSGEGRCEDHKHIPDTELPS